MKIFTCVLDPEDRGISESTLRDYESVPRERGLQYRWQIGDRIAVLTGWDDTYGDPLTAQDALGNWIAIGVVRLDNRPALESWLACDGEEVSDLELVRRVVAQFGTRRVPALLGDFAFIAWNGRRQTAVAACDAFAVRRLYYAQRNGLVAFSSRAEALATRDQYDVCHLAELVAQYRRSSTATVYAGVRAVPRASMAELQPGGALAIRQYWHASDHLTEPAWADAEQDATEKCRQLLTESVCLRMGRGSDTWAQLSGGLDSSSVVSCAQWLAERGRCSEGLAGTVTFVDRDGTGADERDYSNSVVDRWKVPNTVIGNPVGCYDSDIDPPHVDQPGPTLLVYRRDQQLCGVVRRAGGRVLLTGSGGDQIFSGTMLFFADWVVHGHVSVAMREMARRAAIGRVSFWKLAYRNALLPLFPRFVHSRLVHDQDQVPPIPWLDASTTKRLGLRRRPAVTARAYGGPLGEKYHYAIVSLAETLLDHYQGGVIADALDVRHPLLYRPLVEFALRLPHQLRVRPHSHRWILRQAMNGILPEKVRMRVGKSGTSDFHLWLLTAERRHFAALMNSPILADLGVVDPAQLRVAFLNVIERAHGGAALCGPLLNTLATEMWLRIRSGRWPASNAVTR